MIVTYEVDNSSSDVGKPEMDVAVNSKEINRSNVETDAAIEGTDNDNNNSIKVDHASRENCHLDSNALIY